jgi:hypothetical protein
MKELSEEEGELAAKALIHYYAYLVATNRSEERYKELAERLRRKPAAKEEPKAQEKRKRG